MNYGITSKEFNELKREEPHLSVEDIDKQLEVFKSRYERKLITKKVYEDKMKELL